MAARVTSAEVKEIFDTEMDNLSGFITAANLLVDQHLASDDADAEWLKEIERWLSAHFACVRDPRARQRQIGEVKETYAISGGYAPGLDSTPYGQQVAILDYTGTLVAVMGKRNVICEAVEENYS